MKDAELGVFGNEAAGVGGKYGNLEGGTYAAGKRVQLINGWDAGFIVYITVAVCIYEAGAKSSYYHDA